MRMLKYILLTAIILIGFVLFATAQPLPPTGPLGNPVPIGGGSLIALVLGGIFIFSRNKSKREK